MKNCFLIIYTITLLCIGCTSAPTVLPPAPDEKQVKWQQMETYALVHLAPETSHFDCGQWVSTFASAGMKGVILEINTQLKQDQKNIVQALSDACRQKGIKLGLSLPVSLQDKFPIKEVMDNNSPLFELRLKDTAKLAPEDYLFYHSEKHPDMVISSQRGEDCRWVGNYEGSCGETNWSFMNRETKSPDYKELKYGNADGNQWMPAECVVSLRPSWFYRADEDSLILSKDALIDIYYKSVGHNANLLLNFSITPEGRICAADSARVIEWHQQIEKELSNNLLANLTPEVSSIKDELYAPGHLTDKDYHSFWCSEDEVSSTSIIFKLKEPTMMNRLLMQEYIPLGQRIKKFAIEAHVNGKWQAIDTKEETTTIGYKRILRFDAIHVDELRILILESRGPVCMNNIAAYYAASE